MSAAVSAQIDWDALAGHLSTPAIVYDLDAISRGVDALRSDLDAVPGTELCFAVKANRCPPVLRHLAALGLGADVASLEELDAAAVAGLAPVYATAPAFGARELRVLADRGVLPDLDSLSQLRAWLEGLPERRQVGLRLRVPAPPASRPGAGRSPWSRFGIDPTDPQLHELLDLGRLEVVQLHAHAGELLSLDVLVATVDVLAECSRVFPTVERLNLGGGFAHLYERRDAAGAAWRAVAATLSGLDPRPRLVVEPGKLLTSGAGYLVTEVRAAEQGSGVRLLTVDASAWNIMPWFSRRVVATTPRRPGALEPSSIAGCTCHEEDYFVRRQSLPPVEGGDRLVLNGAGAYVTSMARSTHGLSPPSEWLLEGGQLRPAA